MQNPRLLLSLVTVLLALFAAGQLQAGDMSVTLTKAGTPLASRTLYLFDAAGTYLNLARTTDAQGVAVFAATDGLSVKVRTTENGAYQWSGVAAVPGNLALDLPADTVVTVTKGGAPQPVRTVYAFSDTGTYLSYARTSDASGQARFTLAAGAAVKFRTDDAGVYHWSAVVTAPADPVALEIPADTVVTLTKGGVAQASRTVYAFSPSGTYLNYARTTDANGRATFALAAGTQVKFRADDGGVYHWSNVVTAPAPSVSLDIPVDTLVTVTKGGEIQAGRTVYAFAPDNTYLNYARTTDAAGQARFTLATGLAVKFRTDEAGAYHWSEVATAPASVSLAIPVSTTVVVTTAGQPQASRTVYAFDAAGAYLNYARTTDANGIATFTLADGLDVKFRTDEAGVYHWSGVVTTPASDVALDIPADTMVTVTKAGQPQAGRTVYAFSPDGVYLNYARTTNATGQATFTIATGIQVKFRTDEAGAYHWSAVVTAPANVTLVIPADTVVTATRGAQPLSSLTVYAFTPEGGYLGYARTTDAAGRAMFAIAEGTQVKFRITDNNTYWWSAVVQAPASTNIDSAGGEEDTEPPVLTITGVADGAAYNHDVTPVITVTDAHLAETTILLDGQPFASGTVVSAEAAHALAVTARDEAGNVANAAVAFTIDLTPPVIEVAAAPAPNAAGWNNTDVTVTFAATDALSGIDSVSDPITVTTEGANQQITGTAVDKAGNTATATVSVSIDQTPPEVETQLSPAPNENGWNNAPVTVTFAATDALSGIDTVTAPLTLTEEGAGQQVTGAATDLAGNQAEVAWSFTIPLQLDTVTPSHGLTEGGSWIEVRGIGFTPETAVEFGGAQAEVWFDNGTRLVAVAPAHAAGVVNVLARNLDGTTALLPDAFEYAPQLEFQVNVTSNGTAVGSDVSEGDALFGAGAPTISGTLSGGKPPYEVSINWSNEDHTSGGMAATVDGATFTAEVPLGEGFHAVWMTATDALDGFVWTSFYYTRDSTPPDPVAALRIYPAPEGGAAVVLWPASTSADTAQYTVTIREWPSEPGELGIEVSNANAQISAYGGTAAGSLVNGNWYWAQVTPTDRVGTAGIEYPQQPDEAYKFQVMPFFDLHDIKRQLQEKRFALDTGPMAQRVFTWSAAPGTLTELTEVRNALQWFSSKCLEDRSDWPDQLSYYETADPWGRNGQFKDTHWPTLQVPSQPWYETPGWVTLSAVTQLQTELARVGGWTAASSGDWYIVDRHGWYYRGWGESDGGWSAAYAQFMTNYAGPYVYGWNPIDPEHPSPPTKFGFNAWGSSWGGVHWQIGDTYPAPSTFDVNWRSIVTLGFGSPPGVSDFFWTDGGSATPGATLTKEYAFGQPAQWPDPATSPSGSSIGYSSYGQITYNVYRRSQRTLELVGGWIEVSTESADVGDEVQASACATYKCVGGDGTLLNGTYDRGEPFTDTNGNGARDPGEEFDDSNSNGVWDPDEWFDDANGNGTWNAPEPFIDEDAVFVDIPTILQCQDETKGFACNQGGARFVPFKPGAHHLTTPQGGDAVVLTCGVDVSFADTEGKTVFEDDEELYGGLVPIWDETLNTDMPTVTFSADLAPDDEGTFTISIGPDIQLWKGGSSPFLEANGVKSGLSRSEALSTFDVKGVSIGNDLEAPPYIKLDFYPKDATSPRYSDSMRVWTVATNIASFSTFVTQGGQPLARHTVVATGQNEWMSRVPSPFYSDHDRIIDAVAPTVASRCPYLVWRNLELEASGAGLVESGILEWTTPDPIGDLLDFPEIQDQLTSGYMRVVYLSANGPARIDFELTPEARIAKQGDATVSAATPKAKGRKTDVKLEITPIDRVSPGQIAFVDVVLLPSGLSASLSCVKVEGTVGAARVSPDAIDSSRTVTITGLEQSWGGDANTPAPNNICLQAKIGQTVWAEERFTVCAHPWEITATFARDLKAEPGDSGARMWGSLCIVRSASDSGNPLHLDKVRIAEVVKSEPPPTGAFINRVLQQSAVFHNIPLEDRHALGASSSGQMKLDIFLRDPSCSVSRATCHQFFRFSCPRCGIPEDRLNGPIVPHSGFRIQHWLSDVTTPPLPENHLQRRYKVHTMISGEATGGSQPGQADGLDHEVDLED